MDFFGIGQAVMGAMKVYFFSSRRTGRTTSLIEGVKNGDRIVFTNRNEADRVERLCKERGIKVQCVVCDPRKPDDIFQMGSVLEDGRNIFDHTWVEEFYMDRMRAAQEYLSFLEKQTSGYGSVHRETKQKAIELAKWQI